MGNIRRCLLKTETLIRKTPDDARIGECLSEMSNFIATVEATRKDTFEYRTLSGSELHESKVFKSEGDAQKYDTEMSK